MKTFEMTKKCVGRGFMLKRTINVEESQHRNISIDFQGNTTYFLIQYFEINYLEGIESSLWSN